MPDRDAPKPAPETSPRRSSWGWKDYLIVALVLALAVVSWFARRGPAEAGSPPAGEAVSVFDVVLDQEGRDWVDLVFDRPLGLGKEGQIVAQAPATVAPSLAGTWRWRDAATLRFEPNGGFPAASEYRLQLIAERLLAAEQVFVDEAAVTVRTDPFLVESVSVVEEPVPGGGARVVLRGTLDFNYAVDPEQLAPRLRFEDPANPGEELPVYLETGYWSSSVAFRSETVEKTSDPRELALVVAEDLSPAQGNVTLASAYRHLVPLGSKDVLTVRRVDAEPSLSGSRLRMAFSSPVAAGALESALTIEPKTRFRVAVSGNAATLSGDFQPGASYRLRLPEGFAAVDAARLTQAWKFDAGLPDLPPQAAFESAGMFLSRTGSEALAVSSVNVDQLNLTVERVYLNNLFSLLQYGSFFSGDTTYSGNRLQRSLGDTLGSRRLAVRGGRNAEARTVVDLTEMIGDARPGMYRVLLSRPGDWQAQQRWLLLSDLGAVVKQGDDELLVWASNVRSLAPASGARVTVISDQNQILGRGTTDELGIFRLRNTEALTEGRVLYVAVESGRDFTFVLPSAMGVDTTGLDVGGAPSVARGYTAFLYGERDLYRPGETVQGLALLRGPGLSLPQAQPALLRHRDPEGRVLSQRTLRVDRQGSAELELELPPYALTGNHSLELEVAQRQVGSWSFQVEEFVPDRISVRLDPESSAAGLGEPLAFRVESDYLFGAPAAGLAVSARARLVPSPFRPEGWEEWSFSAGDRSFEAREIFVAEERLGEDGSSRFQVSVPPALTPPSSLAAVITARVRESGGRGVAATTRVPVHPYPYYLGLRRSEDGTLEPGDTAAFEFVALTPEGEEVPSGGLRAELFRDRWNTTLRRTADGTYRYDSVRETVLVETQNLKGGQSRGRFSAVLPELGAYRLVLADPATGAASEVSLYASGWGFSPWAVESPGRLELTLDRAEYAPGDVATVAVRAPFPGKLLLTVERDGVRYYAVHQLTGNTASIRVPTAAADRPNAFLTAILVRSLEDLEVGTPARAFGAVPLPVDRAANRLSPVVEAPETVRSGRPLAVTVEAPPDSVITLAAVDEGILQLVAQQTADPFAHFYRQLALGVRTADTFGLLLPEVGDPSAGGGLGAAGAEYLGSSSMQRPEPAAWWSGARFVGDSGRVRVEIPSAVTENFQGALRLMAVAADGRRFGSSEQAVRVRDPLVLLPTVPRALAPGERVEVPVTVRYDSRYGEPADGPLPDQAEIALDLLTAGPADLPDGAQHTFTLASGRDATHYFGLEAQDRAGDLQLTFRAAGTGGSSEVPTTQIAGALAVRPDLPPEPREQAGALEGAQARFEVEEAERWRPETLRRTLSVGPLPAFQLAGRLEGLLAYPYGCLEQTVSRAFPLLYFEDLAASLQPDLIGGGDSAFGSPAALVQEALRRVSRMQQWDGSFSLWPGGTRSHPWASLWTTHFLLEARQAGHPVPDALLQQSLYWVGNQVRGRDISTDPALERAVYGAYLLARAGQADRGALDDLSRRRDRLTVPYRALLASAYAAVGDPQGVDDLLGQLATLESVERQSGGNFDSAVRSRALTLLALVEARPTSPRVPELVRRLAQDAREATPWSTQDSGFAFLALGTLARRQADAPPYSGRAFLGDELLGTFDSDNPAVFAGLEGDGALRLEMDSGYAAGAAFFSVVQRAVPTDAAFRPSASGLEVEANFLNRQGGAADLDNLTQGDLIVQRLRVRSPGQGTENVVVQALLPSGLEVENPRLATAETLPFISNASSATHLDFRDDRVLIFTDLPENSWQTYYVQLRAVAPGRFRIPPVHAEAMYDPTRTATGPRGQLTVQVAQ
ncbi:MAG: MG2 domain-containing protein [Acidobacteriota bacterium]